MKPIVMQPIPLAPPGEGLPATWLGPCDNPCHQILADLVSRMGQQVPALRAALCDERKDLLLLLFNAEEVRGQIWPSCLPKAVPNGEMRAKSAGLAECMDQVQARAPGQPLVLAVWLPTCDVIAFAPDVSDVSNRTVN